MTSQLVLMNLYGVALASDTLSSRRADDGWITSVGNNKIWSVDGHAIQALHYGCSIMGGVPHKIHFEAWVRTLTKPLPNVQAYVNSYKKYFESNASIHSKLNEKQDLINVFRDALNRLNNKVEPDPANIDADAKDFANFYGKSTKFQGATKEWLDQTISKFKIDLNEVIDKAFNHPVDAKLRTTLKRAMKNFALAAYDIRSDSNLVFVGFGSKDEFAGSQRLRIRGIFNNKLLAITEEALYVSPDNIDSRIIYAAQADAMKAFLQGYHPSFGNQIERAVSNTLHEFMNNKKMESRYADELADKITQQLADFSNNQFIDPAFNAIMNMNPEQLAQSAKGLVLMQAAAAGIGTQSPPVGGPVEVVTITKKDGVIWDRLRQFID